MTTHELLTALDLHGEERHGFTSAQVPREQFAMLTDAIVNVHGQRLALVYATDDRSTEHSFGVHALFGLDDAHAWLLLSTALPESDPQYPALTRTVMAAHWYERYAMDMFGIVAVGHPDPRRLVHHENVPLGTHPLRKDFSWNTTLAHADVPYPMHHVEGEGVYEIPVGPIHAGIIEPGHFRINVAGERIIALEGKLFFTHKGVEKLLEGKSVEAAMPFVDRVSGDMAAAHALAYCQAVESACGVAVPERAAQLRTLMVEAERVTMHINDVANMCGMGIGFTIMAAQGFRIKERLMRLSFRICGNRFWRGMIVPGGFARDVSVEMLEDISTTVSDAVQEIGGFIRMAQHSDGLRERLETTGVLSSAAAHAYGAVGVAARASGIARDVRVDHPHAAYATYAPKVITETEGDVYARFRVRSHELRVSNDIITRICADSAAGSVRVACHADTGFGFSAVESWRGEIITAVRLRDGMIDRCVIRDPSFCNWALFGELTPGNIVPDFPLCNKSLNLSYSGTDM